MRNALIIFALLFLPGCDSPKPVSKDASADDRLANLFDWYEFDVSDESKEKTGWRTDPMPAVPIVSVLMGTEDLKPAFSDSKERKWLVKQNAKPVKRIFQIEESSKTGVTSVVVNIEGDRSIAELGVYNSILSETAKLFLNEETQAEFDTWFKENPNGMHDKVFNKLRIRVAVDGRSNFVMMEIRNNE